MKNLEVKCPSCQLKFNYYESDFRPFCSDRCRLVDLGEWLNESYRTPAQNLTQEDLVELEELSFTYMQTNDDGINNES
jgi:endogenous inhibitor of DNA gyrase (YacG/DUF329 family)